MIFKTLCFRIFSAATIVMLVSSCVLLLLNGNLSHGYYESVSKTFKCKLPGGALSRKVNVADSGNEIGETVTFSLDLGILWRLDHLRIGKHKLANIKTSPDNPEKRRLELDRVKDSYINLYLRENIDVVEVKWEQFEIVDGNEVLLANTYVKWDDNEEIRELLFSIDGEYLNVVHYAQNVSSELQNITTGAVGFYKSCQFN